MSTGYRSALHQKMIVYKVFCLPSSDCAYQVMVPEAADSNKTMVATAPGTIIFSKNKI